jgi:hypothetical protein
VARKACLFQRLPILKKSVREIFAQCAVSFVLKLKITKNFMRYRTFSVGKLVLQKFRGIYRDFKEFWGKNLKKNMFRDIPSSAVARVTFSGRRVIGIK